MVLERKMLLTDGQSGTLPFLLFLLSSPTANNLAPDWLIPMYQNRIFFLTDDYFQPFLSHLFLFFYPWFSFRDVFLIIFFSTFHILTFRHLNWFISVSFLFDLTHWLNFSLCSAYFFFSRLFLNFSRSMWVEESDVSPNLNNGKAPPSP